MGGDVPQEHTMRLKSVALRKNAVGTSSQKKNKMDKKVIVNQLVNPINDNRLSV